MWGNAIVRMTTLTQASRAKASFVSKVATLSTYPVPGPVLGIFEPPWQCCDFQKGLSLLGQMRKLRHQEV